MQPSETTVTIRFKPADLNGGPNGGWRCEIDDGFLFWGSGGTKREAFALAADTWMSDRHEPIDVREGQING